jgi:TusA-related sulfurtransferase
MPRLNSPVFILGFPKSGTTSFAALLEELGYSVAHWRVEEGFVGQLMHRAHAQGLPVMHHLAGHYDAVAQMDVCLPDAEGAPCFFPQIALLEEIVQQHPGAVFVLNTRDPAAIVRSIDKWGTLRERIVTADLPGLPAGAGRRDSELVAWIEAHYAAVERRLGGNARYVRFDIERDRAEKLGVALGLPPSEAVAIRFPLCNANPGPGPSN